jgi:hypothetical protein
MKTKIEISNIRQGHSLWFFFTILFFTILSCSHQEENFYSPQEYEHLLSEEPQSTDYEVWINGIKAIVYVARVQDPPWNKEKTGLDFGGNYFFVSFDMKNPVEVTIKSGNKALDNTIFRPDGIEVRDIMKKTNELSFTIEKPTKIIVEPGGKNGPLLLFANPVEDFVKNSENPDLIYYGPGIHQVKNDLIEVGDNQTLYIAEGAVVKAGVRVTGNNVTIRGRGIICGNEFVWGEYSRHLIEVESSNNVEIRDIILRGGATWTMPIRNSKNIIVDNVKIVGGRAQNDDGINPCNSQDVMINNCFIRTDDDCIALKGMRRPPQNENIERITVENSILWCDRARIFLLGHESRAEYMRDITFKNIDIVHFSMTAFLLEPGENMRLENTTFENFRINGEGQKSLIRLRPVVNQYMYTKVPGYINDITFNKISVTGSEGPYKIELLGVDENYNVHDINISDVSVLGQQINRNYKNLEMNEFVQNVNFN